MTLNFDATTGTIIICCVVGVANGIGAAVNNKRFSAVLLAVEKRFAKFGERLARLEVLAGLPGDKKED